MTAGSCVPVFWLHVPWKKEKLRPISNLLFTTSWRNLVLLVATTISMWQTTGQTLKQPSTIKHGLVAVDTILIWQSAEKTYWDRCRSRWRNGRHSSFGECVQRNCNARKENPNTTRTINDIGPATSEKNVSVKTKLNALLMISSLYLLHWMNVMNAVDFQYSVLLLCHAYLL